MTGRFQRNRSTGVLDVLLQASRSRSRQELAWFPEALDPENAGEPDGVGVPVAARELLEI